MAVFGREEVAPEWGQSCEVTDPAAADCEEETLSQRLDEAAGHVQRCELRVSQSVQLEENVVRRLAGGSVCVTPLPTSFLGGGDLLRRAVIPAYSAMTPAGADAPEPQACGGDSASLAAHDVARISTCHALTSH